MDWSLDDVLRSISEAEGLDDQDTFTDPIATFGNVPNVKTAINTQVFHLNRSFGRKAKIKIARFLINPDGSGQVDIKYYVILNYKWIGRDVSLPFTPNDSISGWVLKLNNIVVDAADLASLSSEEEDEDDLMEALDDADQFGEINLSHVYEHENSPGALRQLLVYDDGAKAYYLYSWPRGAYKSISILKLVDPFGNVHGADGFENLSPDNIPDWFNQYMGGFWEANKFGTPNHSKMTSDQLQEFDAVIPYVDNRVAESVGDLDDRDTFANDESYWGRTFQSLLDEGGPELVAHALRLHFDPERVLGVGDSIETGSNYVIMAISLELGGRDKRKVKFEFLPNQTLTAWLRETFMPKLREIDSANLKQPLTKQSHPLFFEGLDDSDTFEPRGYWHRTFQSLIDEGPGFLKEVVETYVAPVVEIGPDYLVVSIMPNDSSWPPRMTKNVKIPFTPDETLENWLHHKMYPASKTLQFEDVSPWGNEFTPWGWQALVVPVHEAQITPGVGLDDTDEFMTGDDNWTVTVTNKHIPGKELVGIVGWERGETYGHFPNVYGIERNDFQISEELARNVVWAAYWQSEETTGGRTSFEPFDLDTHLMNVDQAGIELLKHINDPKSSGHEYPSKLSGWTNVGTHTYGEQLMREDNAFTVTLGGRPFTKLHEVDLINIQMGAWHWPSENDTRRAPGTSNFLYSDAETIMDVYPEMFIYWAPAIDLKEFHDLPHPLAYTPPAHESPDLDDRDEFEEDDPEVDLQKWNDAERLGATAARDKMVAEAQTLLPEMKRLGLELLFVGAGPGVEHKRELRPFIIIGRKKSMTESLDDKDEFGDQMIPVSVTIVYNPLEVGQPPQEVIEIAKMIVIEYGFTPGEFFYKNPRWQPTRTDEMRLFGTLEVDGDLVDWLEEEGGQLELSTSYSNALIKRGNITLILESEEAWLRNHGIDA